MVVAILLTLLGRLSYLQIAEGASYRQAASDNRIREVVTPAARGQILDDRGIPLAGNETALVVSVTRSVVLSQPKDGKEELEKLSQVVDIPAAQIKMLITPCGEKLKDGTRASKKTGCWNGSPQQPVPIKQYTATKPDSFRQVLAISEHAEDFPGVKAEYAAVRQYPNGSLASHVLGYLGPLNDNDLKQAKYKALQPGSLLGRTGVEDVYDDQLRGVDGVQKLKVDKDGTVQGSLGTVEAKAGDNLVLGIDLQLQKVAEKALSDGILAARARLDRNRSGNFRAPKGAVVVVDVTNGQVVAMASNPTYDPTAFVGGISSAQFQALNNDPNQPLLSNATQGLYAPGSTFKISSTVAAVNAGNALGGIYNCPPSLKVGNRVFRNFEGEAFGHINFTTTLVKSCDTVYYRLAYDQWTRDGGTKNLPTAREIFPKTARQFGFGSVTGIDLPDERKGTITDRGYKQRYWDQNKAAKCKRARTGYPEEKDPTRAAYLLALAKEFCTDGYRYNPGDAALFAIGQGDVTVTPLQLAMAYSALANGGTVWEPRLAKGFLSPDGSTYSVTQPKKKGTVPASASTLAYIRNALQGVPQPGGTAQTAFAGFPFSQVPIAGKTGTADAFGKAPTSWFASFAPANAPRYAVVAMVPEAGTGGTTAAPIVRKIYDAMYGFNGQKRILDAHGLLPGALPVVRTDGTIAPPGTKVPKPPVKVAPVTPNVSALPYAVRREDERS
jgi:penicillin-binding protein 2